MTVGIGVICDDGNAVVMAADRIVTVGEGSLVTELDHPKLTKLLPNVWLTITGTVQQYEFALEHLEDISHLLKSNSAHQIARRFQKACHRIRLQAMENRFTMPFLGLRFAEFSRKITDVGANNVTSDLYNKMATQDLNWQC